MQRDIEGEETERHLTDIDLRHFATQKYRRKTTKLQYKRNIAPKEP